MKIRVKQIDEGLEEYIEVRINNLCEHIFESDIEDYTYGGGGEAYDIIHCRVCGKSWTPKAFRNEFDLDDGRFDYND